VFVREQGDLPGRAVELKTLQTGETVRAVGIGGSAGVGGFAGVGDASRTVARANRSTAPRLGLALAIAVLIALGLAASASAADDPLGAVTQAAAPVTNLAAPVANAAAPAATTATAGATETAAAAQTATKAVQPLTPPTDREVSDAVRSAGAAVDSAVRTVKRTTDAAVATTTHVVDSAKRPSASSAPASPASRPRPALKVESSHARPPSRHPGARHDRTAAEPRPSQATAARVLDRRLAMTTAQQPHAVVSTPVAGRSQHAAAPQPGSPSAPALGGVAAAVAGAAASGAGTAALLVAIFLLAAPAIRRCLPAPPPGHRPAAPVFLLERPG
jgi:hypothetical protein